MSRLDETWASYLETAPAELKVVAESLPWKIGLTRFREQGWEAFWTFDPNRRPAHYSVAETTDAAALTEKAAAFDRAHHRAVFWGLLFDRVADGQVAASRPLIVLRSDLLRAWATELTSASSDGAAARGAVARAVRLLRRGTELEMSALGARRLDAAAYARQTCWKLRWCSASAVAFVHQARGATDAATYQRCFDLFGMSVQCMDDAIDAEDDVALHGVSVPALLGVEDGSLVRAACVLAADARTLATQHGYPALAAWLERYRRFLDNATPDGDPEIHRRQGVPLGALIVEQL